MEFTILHQTTYRYPGKIHESYSVVHLRPRSDSIAVLHEVRTNVAPRARIFSYSDRFGNDVQHFAVLARPRRALDHRALVRYYRALGDIPKCRRR